MKKQIAIITIILASVLSMHAQTHDRAQPSRHPMHTVTLAEVDANGNVISQEATVAVNDSTEIFIRLFIRMNEFNQTNGDETYELSEPEIYYVPAPATPARKPL